MWSFSLNPEHINTHWPKCGKQALALYCSHRRPHTHSDTQTVSSVKQRDSCEIMSIHLRQIITSEWLWCLVNGIACCIRQEVGGWAGPLTAVLLVILNWLWCKCCFRSHWKRALKSWLHANKKEKTKFEVVSWKQRTNSYFVLIMPAGSYGVSHDSSTLAGYFWKFKDREATSICKS